MLSFLWFVLLSCLSMAGMAWAQPFTVVHVTQQRMQGMDRIHYVVQHGDNPGPILAFELGLGFGELANEAVALTRSSDVEIRSLPSFGHIDLFMSPSHGLLFELRVLEWVYTDVLF
jgi:hypothetical protein